MRLRFTSFLFLLTFALVFPLSCAAATDQPRVAVVLASFGSTVKEARDVETAFLKAARERYPRVHIVLANTARFVMKKNAEQGVVVPSLFRALADLADQGYAHVAVQSLQIIPGAEFDGVAAISRSQAGLPKGLKRVCVGAPLLASNEDCKRVAQALLDSLPKERAPEEPVVFVGHGAHHGIGGMTYLALQWHLTKRDPNAFVGTIEGAPSQEDFLASIGKSGKKSAVWVAPLLALAGDHAVNDLYGDEGDSWKSVLGKQGRRVKKSYVPLLAVPGVREVFFNHLDAALAALDASVSEK